MLRKYIAASIAVALSLIFAAPSQAVAPGVQTGQDHSDKVWVCKYTTTPGGDEVLKKGNDGLVWVSKNSVHVPGKNQGDVAVGDKWVDAHESSYVLQIGGTEPSVTGCPGYVPPQPKDDVTYSDWTDGDWACNDTTVDQTRTKTTTPYTLVDGKWVLDTANASTTTQHRTRTLSKDEVTHCYVIVAWKMGSWNGNSAVWSPPQTYVTSEKQSTPDLNALDDDLTAIGYGCYQIDIYYDDATTAALIAGGVLYGPNNPTEHLISGGLGTAWKFKKVGNTCDMPKQPDAKVTYSDWTDGQWACNDTTVEQTRTKTVTPYLWQGGAWVLDTANATTTTQHQQRTLAQNEIKHCYVIVAWKMPGWTGTTSPTWPQQYVTSEKQTTPNLGALDDDLDAIGYGCYQVDIYFDDATTTSLIAGGVLTGPNTPPEHLISGGWGQAYKLYKVGNSCEPPKVDICVYEDGQANKVTILESDLKDSDIRWVDGSECTPTTRVCVWDPETQTASAQTVPVTRAGDYKPYVDGSECTPTTQVCVWDPESQTASSQTVPVNQTGDYKPYVDGSECTPTTQVCVWDPESQTASPMTVPVNQTGNYKPYVDGSECTPTTEICVYTQGDATGHSETVPVNQTGDAKPYVDGSECTPDVCPNIVGNQPVIPEGLQFFEQEDGVKCGTPPTLEGSLFAAVCEDDVPWINYDVKLNDPYGVSTNTTGLATFTFTAAGHPGLTYVHTEAIGAGRFLWPGATATDNGDGTFTATGWPGWELQGEDWVSVGDDNFGWTRDGVDVHVEVNPTMDVHLNYPPPTKLCVAGPPTEVHNELDAPPADAVEAEAQYAG